MRVAFAAYRRLKTRRTGDALGRFRCRIPLQAWKVPHVELQALRRFSPHPLQPTKLFRNRHFEVGLAHAVSMTDFAALVTVPSWSRARPRAIADTRWPVRQMCLQLVPAPGRAMAQRGPGKRLMIWSLPSDSPVGRPCESDTSTVFLSAELIAMYCRRSCDRSTLDTQSAGVGMQFAAVSWKRARNSRGSAVLKDTCLSACFLSHLHDILRFSTIESDLWQVQNWGRRN